MNIDIKIPIMVFPTQDTAEYFKSLLLSKCLSSTSKILPISYITGDLSYMGVNVLECYGIPFDGLVSSAIKRTRNGFYVDLPQPVKIKELTIIDKDCIKYPEPRMHVVYEELEMDDLWRVTSLHREETI